MVRIAPPRKISVNSARLVSPRPAEMLIPRTKPLFSWKFLFRELLLALFLLKHGTSLLFLRNERAERIPSGLKKTARKWVRPHGYAASFRQQTRYSPNTHYTLVSLKCLDELRNHGDIPLSTLTIHTTLQCRQSEQAPSERTQLITWSQKNSTKMGQAPWIRSIIQATDQV